MSQPVLLQDKFEGMHKDSSRDQIPKNKVWDLQDYIPNLGAPLRKRGGWSYQGVELSTLDAAATVPKRVFWAAFDIAQQQDSQTQLLAWDNNGKFFDLTTSVDRGDTTVPLHTPIFFREHVIWTSGGAAPKKYDGGGAAADVGGSPPTNARICAVWKERVIMSGNAAGAAEASIYFANPGTFETWDTTNAVVQTADAIQGLAALPNCLLAFHPGSVTKILGDTAPSSTNPGNLSQAALFDNIGLYEPNALAVTAEAAYWADENGVYKTDGAALVDLTDKGGIRLYWQDIMADVDSIALAVWRGYVFVSLGDSDTHESFLVCDIDKKAWFRFSRIVCTNFAVKYGSTDELYFSNRLTKFVGKMSTCFSPASAVKADANGATIVPTLQLPHYRFGAKGRSRLKGIYFTYDMRDAASDNPVQDMTIGTSPEQTSGFTSFVSAFAETTAMDRKRKAVAMPPNEGFSVSLIQTGASSDTRVYAVEAEVHQLEGSRR